MNNWISKMTENSPENMDVEMQDRENTSNRIVSENMDLEIEDEQNTSNPIATEFMDLVFILSVFRS